VYTDNSLVDPWLLAQIIIQHTTTLCPLVAIQPIYLHPYAVAKAVTTLGFLYHRRIYLNMVAGGFKNDLIALNDPTPHDRRYDRLVEYTMIIKELLAGEAAVTLNGEFYTVDKLKLTPPLSKELFPGILMSGSSEAGLAAAKALDATAIQYPQPVKEYKGRPSGGVGHSGMRIGIIARDTADEAWRIARERFPEDRKGQITHQVAMKVSDSVWHKQLSRLGEEADPEESPYWLVPFQNYKTFCPYLVGSDERVSDELARYISLGYTTFVLDVPPDEEELSYIQRAFQRAVAMGQA
jgi:alkanesulfonate monooxygenase